MEARDKLREVAYFLGEMKRLEKEGKKDEFDYNLDAFVVAWHSIHDNTILYDFAEEFKLPFTRKQKMTDYEFALVAGALNRQEGLVFLHWLNRKVKELEERHGLMFEVRHVVIHRGVLKTAHETKIVEVESAWNVSSPATSSTMTGGSVRLAPAPEFWVSGPQWREPAKARLVLGEEIKMLDVSHMWLPRLIAEPSFRFKDNPDESIVDICERAYKDMEQLVSDAEKGEWKNVKSKWARPP